MFAVGLPWLAITIVTLGSITAERVRFRYGLHFDHSDNSDTCDTPDDTPDDFHTCDNPDNFDNFDDSDSFGRPEIHQSESGKWRVR